MNKTFEVSNFAIIFKLAFITIFLSGCKTSGDLRLEKMSKDPSEIKTVTNPRLSTPQVQQTQPDSTNAIQTQAPVLNEDLARQVEVLKGQIVEQQYHREQDKLQYEARLLNLEKEKALLLEEISVLKGAPTAQNIKGGDLLWDTAMKDIKDKNYSDAVNTLKEFLENFPKDERKDEALVLKGQCEYASSQFKEALVTFGSYLDKYPKGKGQAMAWLGQGAALVRMKQKKDAKLFFEQCVSLFPKSKEAKLAKRLLKNPNMVPPVIF